MAVTLERGNEEDEEAFHLNSGIGSFNTVAYGGF